MIKVAPINAVPASNDPVWQFALARDGALWSRTSDSDGWTPWAPAPPPSTNEVFVFLEGGAGQPHGA